MPQEQTITIERNGETKRIKPDLWNYAKEKGWKRKDALSPAPKSQSVNTPVASPEGQRPGGPQIGPTGIAQPMGSQSGFGQSALGRGMTGFGQGLNPLHTPEDPSKLPPPLMGGKVGAFAEDMLNTREIGQKSDVGDKAGGIGMMMGTIVSLAGPDLIKGMLGGSRAIKGLKGAEVAAEAAHKAKALQKEIGGTIEAARTAVEYTRPLFTKLGEQYDKLHKLLDLEPLTHNPQIEQIANKMAQAGEPAIKKLAGDLKQLTKTTKSGAQTLIRYGEAHGMHKQVQRMLTKLEAYKIGHWQQDLKMLDEALEAGKTAVAQSKGVGKEWESLTKLWKEATDLTTSIASKGGEKGMSIKVRGIPIEAGKATLPAGARAAGKELAKKVGVAERTLPRPTSGLARKALKTYQVAGPAVRGADSALEQ